MNILKSLFVILFLMLSFFNQAQQRFWKKADENTFKKARSPRYIIPDDYETLHFDFAKFLSFLASQPRNESRAFTFETPMPDGSFSTFNITETPVFEAGLSAKYPGYYSFTGAGVGQPGSWLKMSVSPFGINMMIYTEGDGFSFIDPYHLDNDSEYISYYKRDFRKKSGQFSCGISADEISNRDTKSIGENYSNNPGNRLVGDCTLRTYRLALSCTGEYASFHGGTIEKVLAAYNTSMTRVNGVYEKDAAITMRLISDTDKLIFLNQSTDPFANGNGDAMLNQNQQAIDSRIGLANYDIGHVFSTGGGGIASLRSPCTANKAKGVTGSATPIGDPYDIDYVCHEMGHQFGALHTFNNSCDGNISSSVAVEPGSGSTIMAYAGICAPNVQNNSDGHFHGVSLSEIASFVMAGNGNTCPVKTVIDNQKPEVSVQKAKYTIPVGTSFFLTAVGEDPDGDNLTYCWEQINNESAIMPPKPTNTSGPAFRSNPPASSPTRYFPDLQRRFNTWEVLPSVARTMDFRCTVRDNNQLGGCTDEVNVEVTFTNQAGPFLVTAPNTTSVNWLVGSKQMVTWNVANTNLAPVNSTKVNIYLSVDGGISYPHVLAVDVENSGSFEIEVPAWTTTRAKVMVASADNIFFDVSNANFKITSTFTVSAEKAFLEICDQNVYETFISLEKVQDIYQPVILSIKSGPQILNYDFSVNPVATVPSKSLLTIRGLQNLTPGRHDVKIIATAGTEKLETDICLFVGNKASKAPELISPADLTGNVEASKSKFVWEQLEGVKDYTFEISLTPSFQPILQSLTVSGNQLELALLENTIYFWRVKGNNPCTSNPFSSEYTFRTSGASEGKALLLKNDILLLDVSATSPIDQNKLDVFGQNPTFITMTITEVPENGILKNEDRALTVGSTFTMEDVIQSRIKYVHSGNVEEADSFRFNIIDDQNRWLPDNIFRIRIRQLSLGIVAYVQNPVLCHGDDNGNIVAEAYGGAPPYLFSLDSIDFQPEPSFSDLSPGVYTVYVKDKNGFITTSNPVNVEASDEINLLLRLENYDIAANATGGDGTLFYSIDDQIYIKENIFVDPGNGAYTIFVKDERGCKNTGTISINIDPLIPVAAVTADIYCASQKATIEAVATGGIAPYTYSVNGQLFQNSPVFQVNAGKHAITVKDAGGKLFVSDSIVTSNPGAIEIGINQEKLKITVNATGGTGALTYSRDAVQYTDENVFIFADNGAYKLYVRDENLCVKSVNISLNVLKNVNETATNLTCFNKNNGYIKLQATNGTFPFQYSLNNSNFSSTREWTGLPAGIYNYAVKDNKNDTLRGEIILTQPDSLTLDWSIVADDLTIIANGGIPPYQYSIDGGTVYLDGNFYEDLPANTYKLSVRDKNNCIVSGEAFISGTAEENGYADLTLLPNPCSDHVRLISSALVLHDKYISLYNIAGNPVTVSYSTIAGGVELDVRTLLPGVYLVVIPTDSGRIFRKLIK
jgi:Metallo-peptidase family M12B Reprolysin-like/SprB repeat/Cadherin-like/Secretion system C-terminal sorting domain